MSSKVIVLRRLGIIVMIAMSLTMFDATKKVLAEDMDNRPILLDADDETIAAFVQNEVEALFDASGSIGMVVSLANSEGVLFQKAYGYSNKVLDIEATTDTTAFRIGSVSKTFCALAAAKLVEEGRLDMDTVITAYIGEDFYTFEYPITVRQLLTHSAGFEESNIGVATSIDKWETDTGTILQSTMPSQVYKPGAYIVYSNHGLALAGFVIEQIVGMPIEVYIEEEIIAPIGMDNTTYDLKSSKAPHVSKGYHPNGEERYESYIALQVTGSVTSTAADMGKYIQYLLDEQDERIMGYEAKQTVLDKQFTMDEAFEGIGLSWYRYNANGHVVHAHSGGTDNFTTSLMLFGDRDLGLFVSSNSSATVELVGIKLMEGLYGKTEVPVSNENAKLEYDIAGIYQNAKRSYTGPDKLLNTLLLTTEFIEGSLEEGYSFRGKPFQVIDSETVFHEMLGIMKVRNTDDGIVLISEEGKAFVSIDYMDTMDFNIRVFGLFTIIGGLIGVIFLINGVRYVLKRKWLESICCGVIIASMSIYSYYVIRLFELFEDLIFADEPVLIALLKGMGFSLTLSFAIVMMIMVLSAVKKTSLVIRIPLFIFSVSMGGVVIALNNLNLIF